MRLLKSLMPLLLVMFATLANAQTLSDINKLAGLDRTLDSFSGALAGAINQVPGEKPAEFVEAWETASADAFNGGRMLAAIEAKMEGKLAPEQLASLHAFYESDLGKAITATEVAAIDKDAEVVSEGARLFVELPAKDPERLALYKRMIDGIESYTVGEAIALNIGYGIISGMSAAAKQPLSNADIRAMLNQSRDQTRQQIEEQVNFATAYTYRDMPIEQVKAYVEFLETPAGKAYYSQITTAMSEVLGEEANQFGDNLYKALGMKKA